MKRLVVVLALLLLLTGVRPPVRQYLLDPARIISPGKIRLSGNILFVNDRYRGVHIFDIGNPALPVRLAALAVAYNVDIAVKGDALYADSNGSLRIYDISQPANPRFVRAIPDACTSAGYDPDDTADDGFQFGCAGDCLGSEDDCGIGWPVSLTRFALVGDFLYSSRERQLKIFSVTAATNPVAAGEIGMGWHIESIIAAPDRELLFLGGDSLVHVCSITNRVAPVPVAQLVHARPFDPVVVQGDHAYVTLRYSYYDGLPSSRLEIINISDSTNMQVVTNVALDAPSGLAAAGDHLYVCDWYAGLEIYDISDPANTFRAGGLSGVYGDDVLVAGQLLIVAGSSGVRIFNIADPLNPVLLATL